jgi:hypothetical protein
MMHSQTLFSYLARDWQNFMLWSDLNSQENPRAIGTKRPTGVLDPRPHARTLGGTLLVLLLSPVLLLHSHHLALQYYFGLVERQAMWDSDITNGSRHCVAAPVNCLERLTQ